MIGSLLVDTSANHKLIHCKCMRISWTGCLMFVSTKKKVLTQEKVQHGKDLFCVLVDLPGISFKYIFYNYLKCNIQMNLTVQGTTSFRHCTGNLKNVNHNNGAPSYIYIYMCEINFYNVSRRNQ